MQFNKAIDIVNTHLDQDIYETYYMVSTDKLKRGVEPDDPFKSKVIVIDTKGETPTIAGEFVRDRRKLTLSEKRKLIKNASRNKSSKARRKAAKMKQFLKLITYDEALDVLRGPLKEAHVIRGDVKENKKESSSSSSSSSSSVVDATSSVGMTTDHEASSVHDGL